MEPMDPQEARLVRIERKLDEVRIELAGFRGRVYGAAIALSSAITIGGGAVWTMINRAIYQ